MADENEGIETLTLDSAFDDEPATSEAPEPADSEKGEAETSTEEPAAEPEGEEPEGEASEEPPSSEGEEQGASVPLAAQVAERKRRQAAEARARELEAEIQKYREKEAPDPYEDPDAFAQHHDAKSIAAKVNASRSTVSALKDDYAEMEQVFMGMVQDESGNVIDASLVARMQAADSPALFVYEQAREHLETRKWRDPEQRAATEAQIRADAVKPLEEKVAALEAKLAELTNDGSVSATELPDLTQATAVGSNSIKAPQPISSLDDLWEGDEA